MGWSSIICLVLLLTVSKKGILRDSADSFNMQTRDKVIDVPSMIFVALKTVALVIDIETFIIG